MKRRLRSSARITLMLIAVLTALAAAFISLVGYRIVMENRFRSEGRVKTHDISMRIAGNLLLPLWNLDFEQVESIVKAELIDRDIDSIFVYDESGKLLFGSGQEFGDLTGEVPAEADARATAARLRASRESETVPIYYLDRHIGKVTTNVSMASSRVAFSNSIVYASIMAAVIAFMVAIMLFIATDNIITRQVLSIKAALEQFETLNYKVRAPVVGTREVAGLALSFNSMADTIEKYNNDLESIVRDRSERLIESEKFALLGSLSAGVAHEINTPLGIGITAATNVRYLTDRLKDAYTGNSMDEAFFLDSLDETLESVEIIVSNLRRAADFVRVFKNVAVDQTLEEKRETGVKAYLDDIIVSLKPTLKNLDHRVLVDCDERLVAVIVPGTLYQIISNLIINSIKHAFAVGVKGTMSIRASGDSKGLTLVYEDDGSGIEPAVAARMFEPFFTTSREKGGTGLGLYILRSIAQQYGGFARYEPRDGGGSHFVVNIPCAITFKEGPHAG